jgi:hypothetical protein
MQNNAPAKIKKNLMYPLRHVRGVYCAGLSDFVVPHAGIFLGKWRSSFIESSDSKMNVQSTCALNTQHVNISFFGFGCVRECVELTHAF